MQEGFSDSFADKILHHDNIIRVNPQLPDVIEMDDAKRAIEQLPPYAESMLDDTSTNMSNFLLPRREAAPSM